GPSRHAERAGRVEGAAVRRDELAGLLALELAADPPDQIALEGDDAHTRAEVRHPGVHGEVRRQLADVEQPAVAPVREEPARTVQVVALREVVPLPVEDLYAVVLTVGDVPHAVGVRGDVVRDVEAARVGARLAP